MSKILGRILLVGAGTVASWCCVTWPGPYYQYLEHIKMTDDERQECWGVLQWDGAPGVLKDATRKHTYPTPQERCEAYFRLYSHLKQEGKKYYPPGTPRLRRSNMNTAGELEFHTFFKKAENVWCTIPDMLTMHGFPQPTGFTVKVEKKAEDYCSVDAVFKF